MRKIGLLIGLAALCGCETSYYGYGPSYPYAGYGPYPYAWDYSGIGLGGVWFGGDDGHRSRHWNDREWHHGSGNWPHEGRQLGQAGGWQHQAVTPPQQQHLQVGPGGWPQGHVAPAPHPQPHLEVGPGGWPRAVGG